MHDQSNGPAAGTTTAAAGTTTAPPSQLGLPRYRQMLSECVHCGLCLNTCPTYRILAEEPDSPRGRLYLMTTLADGQLRMSPRVHEHFDLCLQCRACETVCPAHVKFGTLMELARSEALEQIERGLPERVLRRIVFRELLPHPGRLRLVGAAARVYQETGLRRVLGAEGLLGRLGRRGGKLGRLASRLAEAESLLPEVPEQFFAPPRAPIPAQGRPRQRVALFSGCIASVLFADVHRATIRVARRLGADVIVPPAAGCCGALQAHAGERKLAQELARSNIAAFETAGALAEDCGAILVNAAGCGALLKEYGEILHDDPVWSDRARRFSERVRDVTEWLVTAVKEDPPRGRIEARVAYQDACHLAHGQGVRQQPRELLRRIPGLQLVEIAASDRCCGSAGIYNLQHPEIARQLQTEKVANIRRSGATIVASGNPGCLMQIRAGLKGAGIEAVHTVELLDRAYAGEP